MPNNSHEENQDIHTSIKQVASETSIDPRYIFAIMLQESNGCVRAPTTNYGVRNPGLMQSHNGGATCNEGGNIQNPCPAATITQMIRDGASGTSSGDGLVQLLQKSNGLAATRYYKAARMYNSGSIDPSGDLGKGIATHCYSSDVANRLTGWVRTRKTCNLDGEVNNSVPLESPHADMDFSELDTPAPVPHIVAQPTPKPAALTPKPAQVQPTPAKVTPSKQITKIASAPVFQERPYVPQRIKAVSTNMAPGASSNCAKFYTVKGGDFCNKVVDEFKLSFAKLRQLNTQIDNNCSNLWLGYDYCVEAL